MKQNYFHLIAIILLLTLVHLPACNIEERDSSAETDHGDDDDNADDDNDDEDNNDDDVFPDVDLQEALDAIVAKNDGYGGGIFRIFMVDQGLVWEGVSGNAVTLLMVPMSLTDTFEIASTSKAFTAAMILLLVEEGEFELDDSIGDLLPSDITTGLLIIDKYDYGPQITVRQMLNHTSGMPDYWYDPPYLTPGVNGFLWDYIEDPDRFWLPEELIEYAKQLYPIDTPGSVYHYSDTGYVLLGLLIEKFAGHPLHKVLKERIFAPHGLQDTFLNYREPPLWEGVESHRYELDWDMNGKTHNSADWAGGGLVSSTRDLVAFIKALAKDEIFTYPETAHQMRDWVPVDANWVWYGLGLFKARLPDELGFLWGHDGYGNSWMYYWPQREIIFVGALNQTENDWWSLVVEAAVQIENSVTRR